jgi:NAD(P)-dependent dehydrogenase (short-subunit alcohol dehydrogenase family)
MTILGTAMVTGASRGIGRGIACRLSQNGFTVVINDLPSQKSQLEEVQSHINQQGGKALTFLADVSVENEVTQMIESAVEQTGGLDVVRVHVTVNFSYSWLTWRSLDGR